VKRKFLFGKTWFFEDAVPGEPVNSAWGLIVGQEIYSAWSRFQKIAVFANLEFGRVLLLDNLVQLSTRHEHVYHEMLVHPALLFHPRAQRVLIIGGGDGGVAREVLRHPVKEVYLVDIDERVIEVSQKYLPSVSAGAFRDKRLKVFCQDALKFVKDCSLQFDVIIFDLTDPGGPSLALWRQGFFSALKRILEPEGVAAFQTGYLNERFARQARAKLKKLFPQSIVYKAFVGCFPFDEHSFTLCSKRLAFDKISSAVIEQRFRNLRLRTKYYSPAVYEAAKVLARDSQVKLR